FRANPRSIGSILPQQWKPDLPVCDLERDCVAIAFQMCSTKELYCQIFQFKEVRERNAIACRSIEAGGTHVSHRAAIGCCFLHFRLWTRACATGSATGASENERLRVRSAQQTFDPG